MPFYFPLYNLGHILYYIVVIFMCYSRNSLHVSNSLFFTVNLHLRILRLIGEARRIKFSVSGAAAEVAAAKFPDQIAAVLSVIARDGAFAGVMREAAGLCAEI